MLAFTIRRLFEAIVVMMVVALGAFIMFRFSGDPLTFLISTDAPIEERLAARERLGLDDPIYVQYLRFLEQTLQGRFGVSLQTTRPVEQLIMERLPATVELTVVAALFAIGVGIPSGVYTALHPRRLAARLLMSVSLIGISLPSFLIGVGLIFVFGVTLNWLPTFGRGDVVQLGWWSTGLLTASGLKSLIMPAITLGLFQATLIMRLVRGEMLEVLRSDYIKFARARGLPDRLIHFRHALRNTLIPVVTIMGVQLGSMIAFAIIAETVFQWPGLGLMFINAIKFVDIPVMTSYLVLIGFFFVVVNLIVDLLYFAIDPRLRSGRSVVRAGGA
ncbi:MAG: ABC transporter permease [Burkholderiaceae bacterium]